MALKKGANLQKILFYLSVIVLCLAIDGTLTYDIFDIKIDKIFEWLVIIITFAIIFAIFCVDQGKKNGK